ncbi:MAG: DMT family transporter [Bdellovibrionales bacterium]
MKPLNPHMVRGACLIVIASVLWGVNYYILKIASDAVAPLTAAFLESLAGCVSAAMIYRISPRSAAKALGTGGWRIILMGVLAVPVASALFIFGLRHIDLGVSSILEKTQPIFTVALAAFFLKEKLSFPSICFGLLAFVGAVEVIPLAEEASFFPKLEWEAIVGVSAVVAAALAWAGAGVLGRNLAVSDELGPARMAFLRAAIGMAVTLPLVLAFELQEIRGEMPWKSVGLLFLSGAFDISVCCVLYYQGMKYVQAGVASIVEVLTPLTAVLLGVVLLGEQLVLRQWLGAVIVLVSVTALVINEIRRHEKSTAALEKHV